MPLKFYKVVRVFFLSLIIALSSFQSYANHIFGIDMYYTHVSGNTYTLYLVIYGDCSGSTFGSLVSAAPIINLYNGDSYDTSETLTLQHPFNGVNVTPVCPADSDSTACTIVGSPIPGITRFIYTANFNIPDTSPTWRFLFQGDMGSVSAGRSGSITNILSGSIIQLVDTLNNTAYDNSSSIYHTIPTPFFCINVPANFNPVAIDPDGDSLVFNLVPGINASTSSSVSYILPYTATAPLGTSAGAFSFSNNTGQLSFVPNLVQKGLVVYNVEEYHNGVLRGTSQREMTVVVLSPCTTYPPSAVISDATKGTIIDSIQFDICNDKGPFAFHLNPTDPDYDTIVMSVSGLPTGSVFNITGNNTPAPLGTFNWTTIGVAPGSYTFFVTYKDNGCPLSSTQTLAYTVTIDPPPTIAYKQIAAATCSKKDIFQLTPGGATGAYMVSITQDAAVVQTITGITTKFTDSLAAGTYTITVYNADSCFTDTIITITPPVVSVAFTGVVITPPTCQGYHNGAVTIDADGGTSPYQYSMDNVTFYSSNIFDSLFAGSYTLYARDSNNCTIDTTVTLKGLPVILANHVVITPPSCYGGSDGAINILAAGGAPPFYYMISGDTTHNPAGIFDSLRTGVYTLIITDNANCIKDTTVILPQPDSLNILMAVTPNECAGYSNQGALQATTIGGTAPLAFLWNTDPPQTTAAITGLTNGFYSVRVTDANKCTDSVTVEVTYDDCCTPFIPNAFTPNNDGADDLFRIREKGDMSILTFSIYNRYGQVVYSASNTSDIDKGWDGRFNGMPADIGTYFYYLKVVCGNKGDHIKEFKGDVTLIR